MLHTHQSARTVAKGGSATNGSSAPTSVVTRAGWPHIRLRPARTAKVNLSEVPEKGTLVQLLHRNHEKNPKGSQPGADNSDGSKLEEDSWHSAMASPNTSSLGKSQLMPGHDIFEIPSLKKPKTDDKAESD